MTSPDNLDDPLRLMHDACYQHGPCQAILYDRTRTGLFPGPSYLTTLYERCRLSGRRTHDHELGILPSLFCGMKDLSCEAVVSYLGGLPVVVVGEWRQAWRSAPDIESPGEKTYEVNTMIPLSFVPLGFCFPTGPVILARADRQQQNRNSLFAGYCFFEEAWRTPQQEVLMWLGLSYLFVEFRLAAIHGVRFADNFLTRRFASRFGFRDLGMIPNYLYRVETGDLAAAVVSSLDRGVFEERLRAVLANLVT